MQEGEIFDTSWREDAETRAARKALAGVLRGAQSKLERNSPTRAHIVARAADSLYSCTCRPVAAWLFKHAPEKNKLERGLCRHRVCPHCDRMAKGRLGFELTELLTGQLEGVRRGEFRLAMLTLPFKHNLRDKLRTLRTFFVGRTMRSRDAAGAIHEKRIEGAWAYLTRQPVWKFFVQDYHRVIEVERNRRGWNLHAHTLIKFGPWIPDTEIRDGETVSIKRPLSRADLHDRFRNGTLAQLPAFRWWERREKRKLRASLKDSGVRFNKREWEASQGAREARFLSITADEIEHWLREAWQAATAGAAARQGVNPQSRRSYIVRYKEIRPGNEPGTALKRYRDKKTGKEMSEERPVGKVVQELIKYTTKGSAKGGVGKLKGKVGLNDYTAAEIAEYLRGIKHLHLHQSSREWCRLQNAFEREHVELEKLAARDEGGERLSFIKLVADVELGVGNWLGATTRDVVIDDGLAFMDLWRGECKSDRDFDRRNLKALESYLARMLGEVDSELLPFNLTRSERVQVDRIKTRNEIYVADAVEELAREAMLEDLDARAGPMHAGAGSAMKGGP